MNLCNHFDAICWNKHNKVVQCHICGHVWVPLDTTDSEAYAARVSVEQARLGAAKATDPHLLHRRLLPLLDGAAGGEANECRGVCKFGCP